MNAEANAWYVKTADGDVLRLTLDQIDAAFNAGQIDENTLCLPEGASAWMRLGVLAGLEAPSEAPAPEPMPSPAATPARVTIQAPAAVTHTHAPPAAKAPVGVPYLPTPSSLRPVSIDFSEDIEAPTARRRSRKGLFVGLVAATALLGTGGFMAVRSGAFHSVSLKGIPGETQAAAAAAALPESPAATPPPAAAPPAPAENTYAPPPAPAVPSVEAATSRLSEDQRARLPMAEKGHTGKATAHKKARRAAHTSSKFKMQGFTTGGNKYDPLNAN